MGTKTLNVDLETLQQSASENSDELPSQIVDVLESDDAYGVQITPDGEFTVLQSEDDIASSPCNCNDNSDEIEQIKEERDKYKAIVEKVRQERKEDAASRLREVNQNLPEDEQYSEDELDSFVEDSSTKQLEQTADMLERVSSVSTTKVEESEEDLSGTSNTIENEDELLEQVDNATKDLFGQSTEQVFQSIDEGTFGGRGV